MSTPPPLRAKPQRRGTFFAFCLCLCLAPYSSSSLLPSFLSKPNPILACNAFLNTTKHHLPIATQEREEETDTNPTTKHQHERHRERKREEKKEEKGNQPLTSPLRHLLPSLSLSRSLCTIRFFYSPLPSHNHLLLPLKTPKPTPLSVPRNHFQSKMPPTSLYHLFPMILTIAMARITVSSAILQPTDFLALQAIHKSLSDLRGSRFISNWDFTSDPCNFHGVLCRGDRIVALSLGDPRAGTKGLSGRLNPALGRLSALAELSLVPGRVHGPIPSTISSLSNLRFLALSRNHLSGNIPSISALRRLRTLDLSHNLLSGSVPFSLNRLPELSNLMLSHNRLSGALPPLSSAASLVRLDLKHNSLTGFVPNLPSSLQYLSLSSNRLSGPIHLFLPPLRRLRHLDLSTNRFTGPIPASVFELPLATLQLQRNVLYGELKPAREVRIPTMDVSYNMLWGRIPAEVAGVRRLYLDSNRFWGTVPEKVTRSLLEGRIEVLYAQHNFLTGVRGLTAVVGLPRGTSLCLQYNCMVVPVVDACPLRSGSSKARPANQCRGWK